MSGYRLTPLVISAIRAATAGSRPYGDSLLASSAAPGTLRPGTYDGSAAMTGRNVGLTSYRVLQVAAPGLFAFDRLEQGLEVPLAEAHRAVPLDQLVEDRRAVFHGLGEDLQQVAVLVAVGEDAQLPQLLERHTGVADPVAEVVVVAVRGVEEL